MRPQPWLDRNELTDLLATAETEGDYAYALVCLLALNGLRVSETCRTDVTDLAGARYQPTLRVLGKGDKPAEIPLNRVHTRRSTGERSGGTRGRCHAPASGPTIGVMDVPATPGRRDYVVLLALLVLCVGGGALIGVTFAGQTATYRQFDLPAWAPPSWLFGPVWTLLYTLMAVSAWLVWLTNHPYRVRALTAFGVQLALNFLWTPAFFGADNPALGLVVIVTVLVAVGWWTFEAWRVQRRAGVIQLPYLAWVGFATALNTTIAV